MPVLERGEASDVFILDVVALGAKPGNSGVQVAVVPQDQGVEDQTESGELVLSELTEGTQNDVGEVRPCAEGNGKNLA